MKLNSKEFKRFKELEAKCKAKKATSEEEAEFAQLTAKKNDRGSNDIQWWNNYPALLKDVTNFPFNWIPGTEVSFTGPGNTSHSLELGVMAKIRLCPGIGRSVSDADAFNSQIRQLWLDLHRKYRGIGTYEKADLGIAILAINSAFESLAKFERIYGVINTYHIGNRVVPQGLKEALGISDDLEDNLADFRYHLNLFITKMKQLCLPKGMSVLISDIVALTNIFKDSENKRAFLFMFDSDVFGVYNATDLSTGGCVQFRNYSSVMNGVTPGGQLAFTLSDVVTILDTQIAALLNDDDIARICSDLLAAYGSENVMQLLEVPSDYKVEPVHDYERSLQFHNLTLVGDVASIYDDSVVDNSQAEIYRTNNTPIVIYQNNNTVMCRLGRATPSVSYMLSGGFNWPVVDNLQVDHAKIGEVIFDTWVDNPTESDVMCGTRYTTLCQAEATVSTNTYIQEIYAFGTKVAVGLTVYGYSAGAYMSGQIRTSLCINGTFANTYIRYLDLMKMDWHPILYVTRSTNALDVFGDLDNFTKIDVSNLSRIHDVALLSGYHIPFVSRADK